MSSNRQSIKLKIADNLMLDKGVRASKNNPTYTIQQTQIVLNYNNPTLHSM